MTNPQVQWAALPGGATWQNIGFDIETDGLLPELTKVHCIVLVDLDTGISEGFADQPGHRPIREALTIMSQARLLFGHNVIRFDFPALNKVYPEWEYSADVRDTIVMSSVVWPKDHLKDKDFPRQKRGLMPGNLIGSYSLKAFGYRLGNYKGDYDGGWEKWSPEMHDYMMQDGNVTLHLYRRLLAEDWPEASYELEHDVAWIISRQERRGFPFNEVAARELYADLMERHQALDLELRAAFEPLRVETLFIPKVNNKRAGYVKGEPFIKVKWEDFNPASRDHIAKRLKLLGWEPEEFTPSGKPKVDETTLAGMTFPQAKPLMEYLMVEKRIGQISSGQEAWLKHCKDGAIYGRVNSNGAVTGRMTHSKPNITQVPSNKAPYGKRCRALFHARAGYKLVGADADALELRCLAHFMAKYDGGAYVRAVLEGDKEKGTDAHSVNCRALGMDPKTKYQVDGVALPGRDIAKTWFYAFIYGAGDEKLGRILGVSKAEWKTAGNASRKKFLKALPALKQLVDAVKVAAQRGWLTGLDGRKVYVRSAHSALNTLLQSAGGLIMKKALVILDFQLRYEGSLREGEDFEFLANVHDEWQIEARPEYTDLIAHAAVSSIRAAGEFFNFRCPLDGGSAVGCTWADTH